MKKILTPFLVICAILFVACKQKFDDSNVPDAVKTSFAKQFPGATAKWAKDEENYEAEFKLNGIK
jgi:hypothetical protein